MLREKAAPVDKDLALSVAHTLTTALSKIGGGVGLAAPQVGISARVAVIEFDGQRLILMNPTIVLLGKPRDRIENTEGCLSFPGRLFKVKRYPSVTVTTRLYDDRMTFTAHGWLARIVQHEIDHLDGICVDVRGTEVLAEQPLRWDHTVTHGATTSKE